MYQLFILIMCAMCIACNSINWNDENDIRQHVQITYDEFIHTTKIDMPFYEIDTFHFFILYAQIHDMQTKIYAQMKIVNMAQSQYFDVAIAQNGKKYAIATIDQKIECYRTIQNVYCAYIDNVQIEFDHDDLQQYANHDLVIKLYGKSLNPIFTIPKLYVKTFLDTLRQNAQQ